MVDRVVDMFDTARHIAEVAFSVESGFRCIPHNIDVGGKPTSAHIFGLGGDIVCNNSRNRFLMLDALIKAGFERIGIGKTFIHADDDQTKDPKVAWLY